jgi:hypothetical protein
MTREEFIDYLKELDHSYIEEDNRIFITSREDVLLRNIPSDVEFRNGGGVWLEFITSLPSGTVFNNGGDVYLRSLTGNWSISPDVVFNNGGDVNLKSLTGNWFSKWGGNIEGIDPNRLLNVMIKQGVFER